MDTEDATIQDFCVISDVTVDLNLDHGWVGDVSIEIQSPAGSTVRLKAVDLFDSASSLVGTYTAAGTSLDPLDPLSTFQAEGTRGTWTLVLEDSYPAQDDGVLNSWALNLTCSAVSVSGDTDCDDLDDTLVPGSGCP